jgi:hypothetical protein
MSNGGDGGSSTRRDFLDERIKALHHLQRDTHKPTEPQVRENLRAWTQPDKHLPPNEIRVRPGFIRRAPALTHEELARAEIIDQRRPDLPRKPPLARLTSLPRGVALRTALTLLFLVQTPRQPPLGPHGLLQLPIEGTDDPYGLLDFIAVNAKYRGDPTSQWAGGVKENRKRQVRAALIQLADDDLKMVALPPGGRGKPRFNSVHVRTETGAYVKEPGPYRLPRFDAEAVALPTEFFTRGWVHALSNREIAMWLMLRDLSVRSSRKPAESAGDEHEVQIGAWERLVDYDLTRKTWDTHKRLEAFGLIEVIRDENRRPNGTTIDGARADPHKFRLTDNGLNRPAVSHVLKRLRKEQTNGQN